MLRLERSDLLIVPEDPEGETFRVPVLRVFDGDGFLTRIQLPRRDADDLTGSFCTRRNVRIRLGKELCHAEEEV